MFDGGVGMMGVIEIESVLGGDDPVVRVDAVVVGAEGEAAVAHGAAEHGLATAGEAAVQFVEIGVKARADFFPGIQDGAIQVGHFLPLFELIEKQYEYMVFVRYNQVSRR